ncbi:DUF3800 domain-containing protein [Sphingopyxis sp. OPL5]|uniref:DUF3800 domain-containing protein n=1 Tax=Sphingopyxis sp. OPL5 TaxID=2486273 RepID=UPI00164D310B|nr:DUF3800 domain-containing protein [Sphingopyxis sp. OPL5]QNO27561.1 DUF3800 domain-containing protein [Sphingopyxis sp. OPL5]
MAIVFADESGRNDPPVYVMAGLIASAAAWRAFDAAWMAELNSPPAISVFKMKDAYRGNGDFRGIGQVERQAKCERLARIIRAHCTGRLSVVTLHDAFNEIIKGRISGDVDDPYIFSFDGILARADKLATALDYDGPIDFYFDRQIDKEPLLNAHWDVYHPTLDAHFAARFERKPAFLADEQAPGLQAADMLAWHIRRAYADGHKDLAKVGEVGALLAEMSRSDQLYDAAALTVLRESIHKKFFGANRFAPHVEEYVRQTVAIMTTCENYIKMTEPSKRLPVELMPLPASGTSRYQLVRNCELVGIPHLHRRSDSSCIEQTTAE